MRRLLQGEPALVTSVLGVVIGLAASIGFHLDADQVKAIFGAVTMIVGVLIRSRVVPTSRVATEVRGAAAADAVVPSPGDVPVVGHTNLPPQGV